MGEEENGSRVREMKRKANGDGRRRDSNLFPSVSSFRPHVLPLLSLSHSPSIVCMCVCVYICKEEGSNSPVSAKVKSVEPASFLMGAVQGSNAGTFASLVLPWPRPN